LLNNSLKHGRGDILLRVRARLNKVSFLIGNRPADQAAKDANGLGIGLRLGRALACLLDGNRLIFRNQAYF
jgi:hypothetical protein